MAAFAPSASTSSWTPSSWRTRPVAQDVAYPDAAALEAVTQRLAVLPGLVTPNEVDRLRKQLADVAQGKAFLLQSGDCAELFSDCEPRKIDAKLKLSLLMSLVLIWGARLPVVRVGRIAGQYAKPRSKATEMVKTAEGEQEVLTFRGDNVNAFAADPAARQPDPQRLLLAYFHSSTTLNHIRGALGSGIADLHAPHSWSLAHVRSPALQREFSSVVDSLGDALHFMKVVGADRADGVRGSLESVDYFTSHEGLMLEYEEALTRRAAGVPGASYQTSESPSSSEGASSGAHYTLSAHTIWLGDRTRQLDGAHVEYFRGLANPIGIKVGPSMKPAELVELLALLDPKAEVGRCTLICRFGAGKAPSLLPPLIRAVRASAHADSVIWCCDPMHGNTRTSPLDASIKTRAFGDIVTEVVESLAVHAQEGSRLGGVHLELTGEVDARGESVTECVGGSMELSAEDLSRRYMTHCDPRLNYEQSLDIAFLLSHSLRARRLGRAPSQSRLRPTALDRQPSPVPPPQQHQTAANGAAEGQETEERILAELVRGIANRP